MLMKLKIKNGYNHIEIPEAHHFSICNTYHLDRSEDICDQAKI